MPALIRLPDNSRYARRVCKRRGAGRVGDIKIVMQPDAPPSLNPSLEQHRYHAISADDGLISGRVRQ